uniref:Uncharacterized protein n=1 Tax=Timema shepardi TaxID=629360 RepID=A0A7R9AVG1_TIMSH|nr:unnamed protein product [Timema shepardi]
MGRLLHSGSMRLFVDDEEISAIRVWNSDTRDNRFIIIASFEKKNYISIMNIYCLFAHLFELVRSNHQNLRRGVKTKR